MDADRESVAVDPVLVSMAVRYCLGRRSYAPQLVVDQALAVADRLGSQRAVILRDVREWLRSDGPKPELEVWLRLVEELQVIRLYACRCGRTLCATPDCSADCCPATDINGWG